MTLPGHSVIFLFALAILARFRVSALGQFSEDDKVADRQSVDAFFSIQDARPVTPDFGAGIRTFTGVDSA